MDPKKFLILSDAEKTAFLNTLSEEQRIAFMQSVDREEQIQNGNVTPNPNPLVDTSTRTTPPLKLSFDKPYDNSVFIPKSREEIAAMTEDEAKEYAKAEFQHMKGKALNSLSSLSTIATTMNDMANTVNPAQAEVAPSAIAGGVSGALSGAALGPIGIVGGGLLGMISGGLKAGAQREAHDQAEYEKQRKRFTGLRMAPQTFEEGGMANTDADPEIELPVQEEEGEIMLFPDGKLVDSMATKKHKQMKGNDVTDFIPDGTVIFSNSKKKLIDLSKVKDHVFNITKGNYSEDGNTPGETLLMKDIYGTGKKTPAQIVRKIRKDLPIIEDPKEQIEIETNAENLRRRAQLLLPIMEMQEGIYKKFEFEKPMKFEKGGMARKKRKKAVIPSYEGGGVSTTTTDDCGVGFKKDVDGNCVPDYGPTPIPTPESFIGIGDKAQRDAIIAAIPTYEARAAYMDQVYKLGVKGFADIGITPPVKPITTASPTTPVTSTTTPPVTSTGTVTTPPPDFKLELPQLPTISDDAFDQADEMIATDREMVNKSANESLASAEDLYRSQRFRNWGILASRLGGVGLQNPVEKPVTLGTEHVDNMFPQITESQIQANLTPIRRQQGRVLSAINESGLSGSKIGSAVASTQERLIDAESDVRTKSNQFNQTQSGKRYERLKNIIDLNRSSEVAAENKTTANRNQMVSNVANIAASSIRDAGSLKEALEMKREELKRYRDQNNRQLNQDEYNNLLRKEEQKIKREWNDKMRTDFASMLSKFITG